MFKQFKYDLAFSFAEEDRSIAESIAAELKAVKLASYYLYTEQEARQWGKDLFQITLDVYRNSRFVLMICSRSFVNGYWSGIEQRAMTSAFGKLEGRILPLRTDETKLTGLPGSIVYQRWQNDPQMIARFIASRIKEDKRKERRRIVLFLLGFLASLTCLIYYSTTSTDESCMPVSRIHPGDPVLIRWQNTRQLSESNRSEINGDDTFYLSNTEVTVKQYKEFCKNTGAYFPPQPFLLLDNNPIVGITWDEASAYCRWKKGRLPTEQEWKYAASAGLDDRYSGGNNAAKVAVYGGLKRFKPVGKKCPNGFGLYDMSGNVAEWTDSPSDSSDQFKIVKGGSHKDPTAGVLVIADSSLHHSSRSASTGFRIAWDKNPSK